MQRRGSRSAGDEWLVEPQGSTDDEAVMAARGGFSAWLREGRLAKGMTLEQVARVTRIQHRALARLEEARFEELPADVFVRGFIRNYARCVGLDADEALARYGHCGVAPSPAASRAARELLQSMAALAPEAARGSEPPPKVLRVRHSGTHPVVAPPEDAPGEARGDAAEDASCGAAATSGETSGDADRPAEAAAAVAEAPEARVETVAATEVVAPAPARSSKHRKRRGRGKRKRERAARATGAVPAAVATAEPRPVDAVEPAEALEPSPAPAVEVAAPIPALPCDALAELDPESLEVEIEIVEVAEPVVEPAARPAMASAIAVAADLARRAARRAGPAPSRAGAQAPSLPPSLVIDDDDPDAADRAREARDEAREPTRRNFLPPILLDDDRSERQGGLTLAVIILLIVATLTLSYLMREPSSSGEGVTARDVPVRLIA